jgi:phospholipid/cholesterol/gamma-HCH transport system ATP-binding protein
VLFQGAALFDSLTVWENVAFRLLNADGVPRKEAKARAIEALEQVRLAPHVADRFPSELSGGMQKRAGLARAVVAQPGDPVLRRADHGPGSLSPPRRSTS